MPDTVHTLVETSGLPPGEARLLIAHALESDRAWLVAHADDPLDESRLSVARALLERRQAGEPVAYILGHREFYGLDLAVTPDVLIPRPETELLVALAIERLGIGPRRALDLGTGSGAVAIALACAAPDAEIWAVDVSSAALSVARGNAARHAPRVRFAATDWFEGLAGERFDLIAANPPYVAEADPHLGRGDLRFEPRAALVGGLDGLDCVRRIVQEAPAHLAPEGWLLFEHGYDQAEASRALLAAAGYTDVASWRDISGIPRVSGGRR